jgi:hypothetical protein
MDECNNAPILRQTCWCKPTSLLRLDDAQNQMFWVLSLFAASCGINYPKKTSKDMLTASAPPTETLRQLEFIFRAQIDAVHAG